MVFTFHSIRRLINEYSHHKDYQSFLDLFKSMVMSIFLKLGMVKFLKSLCNIDNVVARRT